MYPSIGCGDLDTVVLIPACFERMFRQSLGSWRVHVRILYMIFELPHTVHPNEMTQSNQMNLTPTSPSCPDRSPSLPSPSRPASLVPLEPWPRTLASPIGVAIPISTASISCILLGVTVPLAPSLALPLPPRVPAPSSIPLSAIVSSLPLPPSPAPPPPPRGLALGNRLTPPPPPPLLPIPVQLRVISTNPLRWKPFPMGIVMPCTMIEVNTRK